MEDKGLFPASSSDRTNCARLILRQYSGRRRMAIGDLGTFPDYLLPVSRNLLLSHGSILIAMDVQDAAYILVTTATIFGGRELPRLLASNSSASGSHGHWRRCRRRDFCNTRKSRME